MSAAVSMLAVRGPGGFWIQAGTCLLAYLACSMGGQASCSLMSLAPDAASGSAHYFPAQGGLNPTANFTAIAADGARIGTGGSIYTGTRRKISAILLFELPDVVSPDDITSASLSFSVYDIYGPLTFEADLWGLGYRPTAILDAQPDFGFGPNGTVAEIDALPGYGIASRVKIEDDILTRTMADPQGSEVRISTSSGGNATLLNFIRSLYDNGATSGDYAVLRLNPEPDVNPLAGTWGYNMAIQDFTPGTTPIEGVRLDLTTTAVSAVPEPSSLALLGLGILGLAGRRARRRRSDAATSSAVE